MRRREFIAGLGGAVAWPLTARAQQRMPVIGYLVHGQTSGPTSGFLAAFRKGLSEIGYVEGINVVIEYRETEGRNELLPSLAADLVQRRVAVIVVPGSTPATLATKAATATIPIVFFVGIDPVGSGLVASLARPGGNITGISNLATGLVAKRLELLHKLVPAATSIALLVNPTNPLGAEAMLTEGQTAARALGVNLLVLNARNQDEIEAAFANLIEQRAGALLVGADALFSGGSVIALAARYAVATSYEFRGFAEAGALMSYGMDLADAARQMGVYAGRILKGEKPAELPVQQATKLDFVINLKTAKTLGLTIPPNLLAIADEVIE
jgi:putative tryptophan/tyrosine transport system substrate-binding protein